jgi:hypothetical protein
MNKLETRSAKAVLEPSSERAATMLVTGKVTGDKVAYGVEIEIGNEVFPALVAFGCLVRPIAGDRVLAARTPAGVFVLSVLERLVPDSATLSLPSGGALAIEGNDISLVARDEFSIDARSIGVRGQKFNLVADTLSALARTATWVAEQLRISAKTQETVADTISSKSLDRVAVVERADVLRAQTLSQTIAGVSVTSAPIAVIATTEDLRLDGKRVTVG